MQNMMNNMMHNTMHNMMHNMVHNMMHNMIWGGVVLSGVGMLWWWGGAGVVSGWVGVVQGCSEVVRRWCGCVSGVLRVFCGIDVGVV